MRLLRLLLNNVPSASTAAPAAEAQNDHDDDHDQRDGRMTVHVSGIRMDGHTVQ
jgi:hypothetical protein